MFIENIRFRDFLSIMELSLPVQLFVTSVMCYQLAMLEETLIKSIKFHILIQVKDMCVGNVLLRYK